MLKNIYPICILKDNSDSHYPDCLSLCFGITLLDLDIASELARKKCMFKMTTFRRPIHRASRGFYRTFESKDPGRITHWTKITTKNEHLSTYLIGK